MLIAKDKTRWNFSSLNRVAIHIVEHRKYWNRFSRSTACLWRGGRQVSKCYRIYLLVLSPLRKVSLLAEHVSPWPSETLRPRADTPYRPSVWQLTLLAVDAMASYILLRMISINSLAFPIFGILWRIC